MATTLTGAQQEQQQAIVDLILDRAPRRRWLALNTAFFGPFFTMAHYLDMDLRTFAGRVERFDWLKYVSNRRDVPPLFRRSP